MRDSSIGGDTDFNRVDGFLMQHEGPHLAGASRAAARVHVLVVVPDGLRAARTTPGKSPVHPRLLGAPGLDNTNGCDMPRTPEQIDAWDAACVVQAAWPTRTPSPGASRPTYDQRYTVEMKFGLTPMGYDVTQPEGDVVEWGVSIKDADWVWPIPNLKRFGANRTWWQSPWANDPWYGEVQRSTPGPDVTIDSGPWPNIPPEVRIANAAAWPAPHDRRPPERAGLEPGAQLRHPLGRRRRCGTATPAVGPWRSGQWQPTVNGGQADVTDPGDATVRWFFRTTRSTSASTCATSGSSTSRCSTRYDGISVNLNDRGARYRDNNLEARWLTYIVGPTGDGLALDYLPFLRDTALGARVALTLKGDTFVGHHRLRAGLRLHHRDGGRPDQARLPARPRGPRPCSWGST